MKERVSVGYGTAPVLLVAPHGHQLDDSNTAELTVAAAEAIDANYVVNRGWRRDTTVDQIASKANCNDFRHCLEDVVKDEFLDPINDVITAAYANQDDLIIVCVHGMGNGIRTTSKAPKLGAVVGYGEGKPPKYTCDLWVKDCFVDLMNAHICETWEGAPGGQFSARGNNNLTQALRQHGTQSLQVEIVYGLRDTPKNAEKIGKDIGLLLKELLKYDHSYKRSPSVMVRSV